MKSRISCPTLIVKEDICRDNIRRMAEKANVSDVIFRPHFKTHQSTLVGNWFREYGIKSITVSSANMAREFASAGWDDITIAFPANLREIPEYNAMAADINLNLLTDSSEVTATLGANIKNPVGIFIEIDAGYGRSGIPYEKEKEIEKIIYLIDHAKQLSFKGFLTHSGNTYEACDTNEIKAIHQEVNEILLDLKKKFIGDHPDLIISIGDTPSCSILSDFHSVDEIRPGNFVYYDLMQYYLGSCKLSDIAVSVACPVTGIYPERNEIVIYGGAVHLSKEYLEQDDKFYGLLVNYTDDGRTEPIPVTRLISISQEHGIIRTSPEFLKTVKHGDLLGILPIHSCLTANLLKDQMIIV